MSVNIIDVLRTVEMIIAIHIAVFLLMPAWLFVPILNSFHLQNRTLAIHGNKPVRFAYRVRHVVTITIVKIPSGL